MPLLLLHVALMLFTCPNQPLIPLSLLVPVIYYYTGSHWKNQVALILIIQIYSLHILWSIYIYAGTLIVRWINALRQSKAIYVSIQMQFASIDALQCLLDRRSFASDYPDWLKSSSEVGPDWGLWLESMNYMVSLPITYLVTTRTSD